MNLDVGYLTITSESYAKPTLGYAAVSQIDDQVVHALMGVAKQAGMTQPTGPGRRSEGKWGEGLCRQMRHRRRPLGHVDGDKCQQEHQCTAHHGQHDRHHGNDLFNRVGFGGGVSGDVR